MLAHLGLMLSLRVHMQRHRRWRRGMRRRWHLVVAVSMMALMRKLVARHLHSRLRVQARQPAAACASFAREMRRSCRAATSACVHCVRSD